MTKKMTEGPKIQKTEDQKYCFVPNIRSNLHLVNFSPIIVFVWSQLDGGKVEQKNDHG